MARITSSGTTERVKAFVGDFNTDKFMVVAGVVAVGFVAVVALISTIPRCRSAFSLQMTHILVCAGYRLRQSTGQGNRDHWPVDTPEDDDDAPDQPIVKSTTTQRHTSGAELNDGTACAGSNKLNFSRKANFVHSPFIIIIIQEMLLYDLK